MVRDRGGVGVVGRGGVEPGFLWSLLWGSAEGRGHFSAQCLMGQKRIWRFPRGVGGKQAARGCRSLALVVVDECRRVEEWPGLSRWSRGECLQAVCQASSACC